jgi:glyoxylase-like metal-dependent hydrolase (beta-lactamase superfamily II)
MTTLENISPRCFALVDLPFRAGRKVNAGLVIGKGRTLIVDTGADRSSAQSIHQCAVSLQPLNTVIVVNTECHIDHTGGNGFFRDRGIDIFGHHTIVKGTGRAVLHEGNEFVPPSSVTEEKGRILFFHGVRPVPPNRPLFADMTISLGAVEVQIFPTPGHTHTNLSVYVPGERIVYCGDCLAGGAVPPVQVLGSAQRRAWVRSIDRIAALAPRIAVPGHGPPLQESDLRRALDQYRTLLQIDAPVTS